MAENELSEEELIQMILGTAEVIGAPELSRYAARAMMAQLAGRAPTVIIKALETCQRECAGRLTLGAILERVNAQDGRPGSDEAWAMVVGGDDESRTLIWTDEMCEAFGVARELLRAGEATAARMAFREAYRALVDGARAANVPARWQLTPGTDPLGREKPIREAVARGRLSSDALCEIPQPSDESRRLLPPPDAKELKEYCGPPPELQDAIARIGKGGRKS